MKKYEGSINKEVNSVSCLTYVTTLQVKTVCKDHIRNRFVRNIISY